MGSKVRIAAMEDGGAVYLYLRCFLHDSIMRNVIAGCCSVPCYVSSRRCICIATNYDHDRRIVCESPMCRVAILLVSVERE
jgi:hypothetical protein